MDRVEVLRELGLEIVACVLSTALTDYRPDEGHPEASESVAPLGTQAAFAARKNQSWLKKLFDLD